MNKPINRKNRIAFTLGAVVMLLLAALAGTYFGYSLARDTFRPQDGAIARLKHNKAIHDLIAAGHLQAARNKALLNAIGDLGALDTSILLDGGARFEDVTSAELSQLVCDIQAEAQTGEKYHADLASTVIQRLRKKGVVSAHCQPTVTTLTPASSVAQNG